MTAPEVSAYQRMIREHQTTIVYGPLCDPADLARTVGAHTHAIALLARALDAERHDPGTSAAPDPDCPPPFIELPDGRTALAYLPPRDEPMP